MLEKLKGFDNGVKIVILFIFMIALGYFIFSVIGLAFKGDESEVITDVDIDNIDQYLTSDSQNEVGIYDEQNTGNIEESIAKIDESKIVKDYSKFYTIQNAMENFVDCLLDGEYGESYSILSDEMRNKYSKKEYVEKAEKLQKERFPIDHPDTAFMNSNRLMKAYKISEGEEYIIEYSDYEAKIVKFGIRLNTAKNQYTIFYIEF